MEGCIYIHLAQWSYFLFTNITDYIYISDVLLWTPSHGRAKAGQPARTYIQQLCEDTGCSPEDLPEAMNDREEWREREPGVSVLVVRQDDKMMMVYHRY